MTGESKMAEAEFAAIQSVYKALEPLDDGGRARVVRYISSLLEIAEPVRESREADVGSGEVDDTPTNEEQAAAPKYSSLAELFNAAGNPKTNPEKALVAGYWLQVCQGAESFDGFSANKELKQLGEGSGNITNAIEGLKLQKPALALQLKKSGTSQQARKTYKLTVAGIKAVERMIKEHAENE